MDMTEYNKTLRGLLFAGWSIENVNSFGATRLQNTPMINQFINTKRTTPGSLYLYITEDCAITATGCYVGLECLVPSNDEDHKGYPMWTGDARTQLIYELMETT